MDDSFSDLKEVNPVNPPDPLDQDAEAAISVLVARQNAANGLLMQLVNFVGGQVEDGMKLLPAKTRGQVEAAAQSALEKSFDIADKTRGNKGLAKLAQGDRFHKTLATLSGALGGLGGLPTALAELPFATTVIFRAVQDVAELHGEDPADQETRVQCLQVFGAGGPQDGDGMDTAFLGAKMALSGTAIQAMIARIAPKFATVLSQKLAAQAVPVLGAAAGAGTNYAFVGYYIEIAHVHFGLRALARNHGDEAVAAIFHAQLAEIKLPRQS